MFAIFVRLIWILFEIIIIIFLENFEFKKKTQKIKKFRENLKKVWFLWEKWGMNEKALLANETLLWVECVEMGKWEWIQVFFPNLEIKCKRNWSEWKIEAEKRKSVHQVAGMNIQWMWKKISEKRNLIKVI